MLDSLKLKDFADDKLKVGESGKKVSKKGRAHCGNMRNCSLRAISHFPTVFFKFKVDESGRKVSKRVEITVEIWEIARYEQFLVFP